MSDFIVIESPYATEYKCTYQENRNGEEKKREQCRFCEKGDWKECGYRELETATEYSRTLSILQCLRNNEEFKRIKMIHFVVNECKPKPKPKKDEIDDCNRYAPNRLDEQAKYLQNTITEALSGIPCYVHIIKRSDRKPVVDRRIYFGCFENDSNQIRHDIRWGVGVSHYFQEDEDEEASGAVMCLTENADILVAKKRYGKALNVNSLPSS